MKIVLEHLEKKIKGLQTTRQYELDKSKERKRKLDKIENYVRDFYMHPYSKEVIEIKTFVMKVVDEGDKK